MEKIMTEDEVERRSKKNMERDGAERTTAGEDIWEEK